MAETTTTVQVESPSTSRESHPSSAAKLEDLPPRLLGRILSFIPSEDHRGLKEVSPGWDKLIDEHIGIPAYIGKSSDFKSDTVDFSPPELLTQIGISTLQLINIHDVSLPEYKFPNLVKDITFVDYISEKNFLQALTPLTNLRSLSLDISTCHYLEFRHISLDFLTRLDTFSFTSGEYCSEWNEEVHPSKNEVDISLENFFNLLSCNHFRSLKSLLLGVPIVTPLSGNFKFANALFKCALVHHETLRHIEVFFDGKLEGSLENLAESTRDLDLNYEAMEVVQLNNLYVNLHAFHQEFGLHEPWLRVLNTQKSLKRCIFIPRGGDDEECVELPLPDEFLTNTTSASTLVVFKWYVAEAESGEPGLAIDCSIFQRLVVLADLNLTSAGDNASTLVNVAPLPLSLRRICVEGIHVRTDDIEILATEFPSLVKLSLTSVGEETNFGMDIETLRGIFERKKLAQVLVMDGFNKLSIRMILNHQEEGSFSFVVVLINLKYWRGDCYFHMKLSENGEYTLLQ